MLEFIPNGPLRDAATLAAVGSAIAVTAWLACHAVERLMISSGSAVLERRHRAMMRLNHGLEQRLRMALGEAERIDSDRRRQAKELFDVRNRIKDLQLEKRAFTRSLGEEQCRNPATPAQLFVAMVVNEAMQKTDPAQRESLNLPLDWAMSQRVEVWANDLRLARHALERAYLTSMGFAIQTVAKAADPAVPQKTAA